jgi:hypothetical protein
MTGENEEILENDNSFMNEETKELLYMYAYAGCSLNNEDLRKYAKVTKKSYSDVTVMSTMLSEWGYLVDEHVFWWSDQEPKCIRDSFYVGVLLEYITQKKEMYNTIFDKVVTRTEADIRAYKCIKYALEGRAKELSERLNNIQIIKRLRYAVFFKVLAPLSAAMTQNAFTALVSEIVLMLQVQDNTDDHLPEMFAEREKAGKIISNEAYELKNLYRYYSHGEYTPKAPTTGYGVLLEAVRTANAGNYAGAVKLYNETIKIMQPSSKGIATFNAPLDAYFHVMSNIQKDVEGSKKLMEAYLKRTGSNLLLHVRVISSFFSTRQRIMPKENMGKLRDSQDMLLKQFAFLFGKYAGLKDFKNTDPELYMPRSAIMRHELSAYLPLSDEERENLRQLFGDKPILTSLKDKKPWELTLDYLLRMRDEEMGSVSGDTKPNRIMYIIENDGYIEAREQSWLKAGRWGSGRALSFQKFASCMIDSMNEQDRNIAADLRRNGYGMFTPEIVLPNLVGSDRVYTGKSAPYEPVTVTEEKPYVIIEKERGKISVRANFEPTGKMKRYNSATHIVTQRSNNEYVVVELSGRRRKFYEELIRQREFPIEAEEELKKFFPKVTDVVEIHSSTFAEGNSLETVDGDSRLCLQATPTKEGFRLRACVRPLRGGSLTFPPGQGMTLVPDEADGKRVQVKRKLREEKSNRRELTAYLEDMMGHDVDTDDIAMSGDEMLQLVDYVRNLGDNYFMEWPEGEALRLRTAVEPKEWYIIMKRRGGWFDMEGDVKLDDDTLMSFARLLEMVGSSKTQFVRLGDNDYLRLSDNLRRQLQRIEAMTVNNKGKLQMSTLQAGLLPDDAIDGEFTVQTDDEIKKLRESINESRSLMPKVPTKLKATLRDYQLDGFQWIARLNNWGAGACLADDMGLGKTVQTIAYLLYVARKGASLVVAPASVIPNWRKELERFAPSLNVLTLNDSADRKATIDSAKSSDVVISTYGLLVSEAENVIGKKWNVVCLDEAHTIKNRETKTSASAMKLKADNRLILTGTPVQNHLGELWNLFQFINPGLLGSYENFQQKFITPIEMEHDKVRQQQLNRLVHPFMLRRTKSEVVEELPDKEDITISVEMSDAEMSIYEIIRRRAKEMVSDGGANVNVATLAEITKLRQAACCAELVEKKWKGGCSKVDRLVDLMTELRDGGNRALVFSQFTSFFAIVRRALDKAGIEYLYLDGSVPVKKREKLVDEFQNGDCPFFLISLKAGGLGLNLTGANYIIHLDPWWNPAIEQQATDRAYRIGQKQKVTAYHLVASNTIEEKIMRMHESKRNLADALLSGSDMSHKMTAKELMEILEEA